MHPTVGKKKRIALDSITMMVTFAGVIVINI